MRAEGRLPVLLFQFVILAACCLAGRAETPSVEKSGDQPAARAGNPDVFFDRRELPLEYAGPGREIADPDHLEDVRIGYFGPDDPSHPEAGDLWCAASLAVEQANQRGGYRGKPFRLVAGWSEHPWSGGAAQVTRMVYVDKVWAIVGGIDGPTTHVAEQITTKARLPLVCAASSDRTTNSAVVPWMFSLLPGDQLQAPVLAAELASRRTIKRVVAIVGADHDSRCFMSELNRSFARYAVAPKFQFVYRPSKTAVMLRQGLDFESGKGVGSQLCEAPDGPFRQLTPDPFTLTFGSDRAVVELVTRSLQAQPDAVVLAADATGTAQIVGQLRQAGFVGEIFAGPSMGRRRCQQQLGKSAENVVFPLLLEPGKRWPEFAEAFRTRFGRSPDYAAASTFDAVQLLVAAIGQGGLNRARIGDAIRQLSPWQGVAGVVKWDTLGGNSRTVRLGAIDGGRVSVVSVKGSLPQSRGGAEIDRRD